MIDRSSASGNEVRTSILYYLYFKLARADARRSTYFTQNEGPRGAWGTTLHLVDTVLCNFSGSNEVTYTHRVS